MVEYCSGLHLRRRRRRHLSPGSLAGPCARGGHHTGARRQPRQVGWSRSATYVLIPGESLIDVAGREFVQLLVLSEDNDGDVDGAEDGKLMRLLEQAAFALQERAM